MSAAPIAGRPRILLYNTVEAAPEALAAQVSERRFRWSLLVVPIYFGRNSETSLISAHIY